MDDLMQELLNRDDTFQQAKSKGFEDLPDGRYVGQVEDMKLVQSGKGRLQIKTTLRVSEGEYENRYQWHYQGLEPDDMLSRKGKMSRWGGGDLESLSLLPSVFDDMIGKHIEFNLKAGRDNQQRIYLGKIVE